MFRTIDLIGPHKAFSRLMAFLVSMMAHALLILVFCILPLAFLGVLPDAELFTWLIAAPVPPPPSVPPAAPVGRKERPQPKPIVTGTSIAPGWTPPVISPPDDEPGIVPLASELSNIHGEISGETGFGFGGAVEKSFGLNAPVVPVPAPPPLPKPRDPMKVGGVVQEAKLICKVQPVYPDLALRMRASGAVILEVGVDEEGNVYEIKILKGHPLLEEAAVNAVRQWKYAPTLLNGEPVPVVATVTVVFSLR